MKKELSKQERYYRDILNAIYVRLRNTESPDVSMVELRKEVRRVTDMIRAHLDREMSE